MDFRSQVRYKELRILIVTGIILSICLSGYANNGMSTNCSDLLQAGDSAYSEFDNSTALEKYRQSHTACPAGWEPFMKYTRTLNDVGEDKGDQQYYRKTMKYADSLQNLFPDSMQGYFLKAAAAGNLAQVAGAREKVKLAPVVYGNSTKAIELAPDYAPARVVLGGYYLRIAKANSFLKFLARSLLGDIPDGNYQDALAELKRAIEINDQNIYAHLKIAQTYLAMGEKEKARINLQKIKNLPVTNHFHPHLKKQADRMLKTKFN